jgi:hypothetical protein
MNKVGRVVDDENQTIFITTIYKEEHEYKCPKCGTTYDVTSLSVEGIIGKSPTMNWCPCGHMWITKGLLPAHCKPAIPDSNNSYEFYDFEPEVEKEEVEW